MFLALASIHCPSCRCRSLHHSKSRGFDWPFKRLGFLPARCSNCRRRFYRHRRAPHLARLLALQSSKLETT